MILNLLKLSNLFLKEAKARWKEEGHKREDPYFDQVKYDRYLEDPSKEKDFIKPQKELLKYLDDPNVFITYTTEPILGTNYSSYFGSTKKYDTPAGFYAYPIVELTDFTADYIYQKMYN